MTQTNPPSHYIGRFAPSPTGQLHFGSLVAALASYLDAKSHQGKWLIRMEDIDPPREEAGAADSILRTLEAHHLHWDDEVLYQSRRQEAYREALTILHAHTYRCGCNRQRITSLNGAYDSHCRHQPPSPNESAAVRLCIDDLPSELRYQAEHFNDCYVGPQYFPLASHGDFIIYRKDHFFAYQLATAVDDRFQKITHVIRGHDLIDSSSRQRYIQLLINHTEGQHHTLADYGHTPLAMNTDGSKLSKQNKAKPIRDELAVDNLNRALCFLNHSPPKEIIDTRDCAMLLSWAVGAWSRERVPRDSAVAPCEPDA